MGSIVSGFSFSDKPDPVTGLTQKEQKLIQSSWSLVQTDPVGNGIELFLLFFKNHPHHKALFPFQDIPNEDLFQNKMVQGHARNVMFALTAIVDNLDNTEVLINLLKNNGRSHATRGIPEQGYWDLKGSVLELLEQELGPKITKDALNAWSKVLDVAFTVITQNMKEAQNQLN